MKNLKGREMQLRKVGGSTWIFDVETNTGIPINEYIRVLKQYGNHDTTELEELVDGFEKTFTQVEN